MEKYDILELMRMPDSELINLANWYRVDIEGKKKQETIYAILDKQALMINGERPPLVKKVLK